MSRCGFDLNPMMTVMLSVSPCAPQSFAKAPLHFTNTLQQQTNLSRRELNWVNGFKLLCPHDS